MRLDLPREWYEKQAALDDPEEVAAGRVTFGDLLAAGDSRPKELPDGAPLAFRRLINLTRREQKLGLEELADRAEIALHDLVAIEHGIPWQPDATTIDRLAMTLGLPADKLLQLAGVTEPRDETVGEAAVRFAARSQPLDELRAEERQALEQFLAVLTAR